MGVVLILRVGNVDVSTVILAVWLQAVASVTVTVYVPPFKLLAELVVLMLGVQA